MTDDTYVEVAYYWIPFAGKGFGGFIDKVHFMALGRWQGIMGQIV